MEIENYLLKTKTEFEFLKGIQFFFLTLSFSNFRNTLFSSSKGINNLLKFLKVEKPLRDALIEKTYAENSIDCISKFFITYNFCL